MFRFEFPEVNNPEKMSSKVVSNLLYYQVRSHTWSHRAGVHDVIQYFQTNYFVCVALVFLTVFFFVPWKMLYIVIVLAIGSLGTDKNQSFLIILHFQCLELNTTCPSTTSMSRPGRKITPRLSCSPPSSLGVF